MRRLYYLLMCTAISGLFFAESAHAQKPACPVAGSCPAVPGPYPQPACNSDPPHTDPAPKLGVWKVDCTNKSAAGNFEWSYDEAGLKPLKRIAKCIYDQGRNNEHWLTDPDDPRQYIGLKNTNTSRKTSTDAQGNKIDEGEGNERTIYWFFKALNSGVAIKQTRVKNPDGTTGPWTEVDRQSYSDIQDLIASGFISSADPPECERQRLRLVTKFLGGNTADVRWSVFEGADPPLPSPILTAGDSVYIDDLSMTAVISHDSRFSLSASPPGIELTATTPVSLNTGDVLATITLPAVEELYYSTNVVGAVAHFLDVIDGAPTGGEQSEQPEYASTAGVLNLLHDIPTVSEWGLIVMTLLALTAGTIVFARRRRPAVA